MEEAKKSIRYASSKSHQQCSLLSELGRQEMRKGNIREWPKDEVEEGRRLLMMMIRANADDGLIN